MTATTTDRRVSLLRPCYGFKGSGRTESIPRLASSYLDAGHFLQVLDMRHPEEYRTLREADTPQPEGAYLAVELRGGRQSYYRSVKFSNHNLPWWLRLAQDMRDSFTVWGRMQAGNEVKIFDPAKPARTSSGRGAIYTRWPIFDRDGQISGFGWEMRRIEFQLLTRRPELGDKLRIKVDRTRGTILPGESTDHDLYGDHRDALWSQLEARAKVGFEATCSAQPPVETGEWYDWFQRQRLQAYADSLADADNCDFASCFVTGKGWLAALDAVHDAWQLSIAIQAYGHMFPQVPPNPERELSERELEQVKPNGLIFPAYEGPTDGMEGRLLAAYYRLRPNRRELFEYWMANYAALLSNLRNYTGD